MCDTVFTLESLLYTHFDQHVVNQKVSVFKCPDCSLHYAQKQLMLDHIKVGFYNILHTVLNEVCSMCVDPLQTIHGTLKTVEGPPNLGINLPLSIKPSNSTNNSNSKDGGNVHSQNKVEKKPAPSPLKSANSNSSGELKNPPGSGFTCGDCSTLFSSREVFVAHVRREHGKVTVPRVHPGRGGEEACCRTFAHIFSFLFQILKKHPCRQCDKSFSSSHSLCRHNRLKHRGLRKVYSCP